MRSTQKPLRIGIALDGLEVPNWAALVVSQLIESPFCDVVVCLMIKTPRRHEGFSLYELYSRLDDGVYGHPDDALAPTDVERTLGELPRLEMTGQEPGSAVRDNDEEALRAVREADLDVLVCLSATMPSPAVRGAPRYGAWSLHHADSSEFAGGPSFFWEAYERRNVTGQELHAHDATPDAKLLARSWSSTDFVSLRRGRSPAYWKAAHFVIRRLSDLHELGWDALAVSPVESAAPVRRAPDNRQVARFAARIGRAIVGRRLRRLVFREQWFVALRRPSGPALPADAAGFGLLTPPRDRFFADPFVVSQDGVDHLLIEDLSYKTGKGVIAYVTLRGGKPTAAPRVALERPYHLSYPFTFEWEGSTYMIPETSAAGTVELYRAERIPDEWRLERVLLRDIDAADATLLRHDGIFWLFAAVAVPGATKTDELYVFSARDLHGEWTSHPRNPVVSDVRRARPAGRVFTSGGRLVRPAQDCSVRYGGAIVFHSIDELTQTEYRESVMHRFTGAGIRGLRGTHTYNRGESYEVIDGIRPRATLSVSAFRRPGRS
jgi:hypothetical protein